MPAVIGWTGLIAEEIGKLLPCHPGGSLGSVGDATQRIVPVLARFPKPIGSRAYLEDGPARKPSYAKLS